MSTENMCNLASELLGSQIIYATDEWFAAAENMLKDSEPVWKEEAFTTYGKWMDGWESRRRRTEGHDWAIVKLGMPGIIHRIDVDTAYFTGNFSPMVQIQSTFLNESPEAFNQLIKLREESNSTRADGRMGLCASEEETNLVNSVKSENWPIIVPLSRLGAGYQATRVTSFQVDDSNIVSHLRIHMGPDGGIARIRVYGTIVPDINALRTKYASSGELLDLAAVEVGGVAVACSNKHYGHPRNLIVPGRGNCMADGWETARQPNRPPVYVRQEDGLMHLPGCDWSIIKLGVPGTIQKIIVDTNFYKGNYPESCLIETCVVDDSTGSHDDKFVDGGSSLPWEPLLPRCRLGPNAIHEFEVNESFKRNATHVKLTIYPDGGVMRLRLYGNIN